MQNELLIMRREDKICSLLVQDKKIIQIHVEADSYTDSQADTLQTPRVGDIYVGKVRNIVKNINAAFVEFAKGQMGYLALSEKTVPLHTQERDCQEGRVLIGDEILVQIKREASKTKPPTLTGIIDLAGRYGVLSVGGSGCHVSKKIKEKEKRETIRSILQEYSDDRYGFIARTNCENVSETVLRNELENLLQRYEKIVTHGLHRTCFTKLESAPPGFLSDIRDGYDREIERIITDDEMLYQMIQEYLKNSLPDHSFALDMWEPQNGKLDAVYNVSRTIEHALMPKVWMKTGAYLVIQPTEALISVDVNTGKAVSKKKDVQKTFFKVNVEAAKEIAYQLRLRNLSGIILVDFIDMTSPEDNKALLEVLRREVKKDPIQTTVVDMTKLGLVEITRKKVKKSLYEQYRPIEP